MNENFEFQYSSPRGETVRVPYFDSRGEGPILLFLHGFASASYSWDELLPLLPDCYRFVRLNLMGFSAGSINPAGKFAPSDQAELVRSFILRMDFENLVIVGHSLGATAAIFALDDLEIRRKVKRLILLDPLGGSAGLPPPLDELAGVSSRNPLRRSVGAELTAFWLLTRLHANTETISDRDIGIAAQLLELPEARTTLASVARQAQVNDSEDFRRRLRLLQLPALLIRGSADRLMSERDAAYFCQQLPHGKFLQIANCGHLPQEEAPELTAEYISTFLAEPLPSVEDLAEAAVEPERLADEKQKVSLRKLLDRWTPHGFAFLLFLKFLQLLRFFGVKAKENGWRKATGIFMRNEYSKFILASFRLCYYRGGRKPKDYGEARSELISRLSGFLHEQSSFHWSAEPGFLIVGRRKIFFCDIVEAEYAPDGKLARIIPHFDDQRGDFRILLPQVIEATLGTVVKSFNDLSRTAGQRRAHQMARRMRGFAQHYPGLGYAQRSALKLLVDRLMTATYLHCEQLPAPSEEATRLRLRTPQLKKYRHPGWGLLNIFCRFTDDFSEADLWVQFHHVPVDGAPMQELLEKLKNEWGSCGHIHYPARGSSAAKPEIFHCGDRLFRARFYVRFDRMLKLRNRLNKQYADRMEGSATIAGMILWGLSRHPFFRPRKMLFPVDSSILGDVSRERELSLIFIRPGKFDTPYDPLAGFLAFQKEFNRRIRETRAGTSAADEFLNLCSMTHPIFYHLVNILAPGALREIVGTVGVSIIRDAEMFISPLSDFQTAGFMAIGDMSIPTDDGESAGAVSVCGSREQIRHYIEAVSALAEFYPDFLGLGESSAKPAAK